MRRLVICAALATSCGGEPPSEPAAAPSAEAPVRAEPEPEPPVPTAYAEATRIEARAWWRHVALAELSDVQPEGDDRIATIGEGTEAHRVRCDVASLEVPGVRDGGYRDAIDALVLALRDERGRSAAREHLERLTKTERGAWENWIGWHDQHGDFLVYNAELDRVDVDAERMQRDAAPVVDGLTLDVRLKSERIGQGDPLEVIVSLKNVADAPLVVDQRLALGHALKVEVRAHAPQDVTPVELRAGVDPGPPGPGDFITLPPGASIDATIDLAPRLASALVPGHYMVRSTYAPQPAPEGTGAWRGTLPSLRRFVRVVPW